MWRGLKSYDPRQYNFIPLVKAMKGRGYGRGWDISEYQLTEEDHPEFYQLYLWQIGNIHKYYFGEPPEEAITEEEEDLEFWDAIHESITKALGLEFESPEDAVRSLIENYNDLLEQVEDLGLED
jgi:hypothetical protein